ncbi:hypothetical protein CR194_17590 [Salipaludibacillus keqinensis]|uniref:DUF4352 domain-containing protein n=1 Tax=Salipaludibacillus keqinensis TaxID=2045207 RepID=A0A323T9A6_9BACI|nr:DUF4352 domain-containing protein [Salipaludibacillus keqinensis]PYZ92009.1 hypothetical protein CR194_17590 [Salipaludibacillus keqinensis]
MMKKVRWILISLGVVLVLSACEESSIEPVNQEDGQEESAEAAENSNNNGDDETQESNEEVEEEIQSNEEEVVEEKDLGIGKTVDFNGLHVTVKEARKYEGDGDWEVPENDFFIILDVSIENKTDEEANVSTMLQMDLVDPDGYAQGIDFMVDTRGSLDGEVGSDRTMAGEIAFDVEEADFYEFIFEDPFMSGQAIWKLEASDLTE